MNSKNFFTTQYLNSWRLSIEKLKIRSLKEKIIECDWNWYSICWYFIIYFCSKSENRITLFPSWNMKNFMNEMSWNSQVSWFISLKQAEPLHRLCSVLFWLDWLKILCRRQKWGLPDELMISLKAFQQCLAKEVYTSVIVQITQSIPLAHITYLLGLKADFIISRKKCIF